MKALQNKLQISNKTLGENVKNWIWYLKLNLNV
jgi:hypothetical protein